MVVDALDGNSAAVVAAINKSSYSSSSGGGTTTIVSSFVDYCGTWEETEVKYGHTKSWWWKKDTAFTMACSQGDIDLVKFLLAAGADPLHSVCNEEDEHYTGAVIARKHGHKVGVQGERGLNRGGAQSDEGGCFFYRVVLYNSIVGRQSLLQ
jgi:hypothetical protein